MHSYKDFKVEVITLYPKVIVAQEHTLADFDRLVADRTRTPIRSEMEVGAYYHDFLIVSRFLIAKGRISMQMQARHFLASFEPCLATAIHSQLERKFPNHFPDDPYKTDDIYDAALYALAWQHTASLIEPPREILTLSMPVLTMPAPPVPAANIPCTSACYRGSFTRASKPSRRDACTHVGVYCVSCTSPVRCADNFYADTSDLRTNSINRRCQPSVSTHATVHASKQAHHSSHLRPTASHASRTSAA